MTYIQPVTHTIIQEVAEAIENGYSYDNTVEYIRAQYGISDHSLARIHDLMSAHSMEADREYMKLAIDITAELEGTISWDARVVRNGAIVLYKQGRSIACILQAQVVHGMEYLEGKELCEQVSIYHADILEEVGII